MTLLSIVYACSNPVEDKEKEEEERVADSIAQAEIDYEIINSYLAEKGYQDAEEGEYGLRYIVKEQGEGALPEYNDIITTDYIGMTTDDEVFDTSIEELAIELDSISWEEQWQEWEDEGHDLNNSFTRDTIYLVVSADDYDTLYVEGYSTADKLNAMAVVVSLDRRLYSGSRVYEPYAFNHSSENNSIPTGLVYGFREGLFQLTPDMANKGRGIAIFPSAIGYGDTESHFLGNEVMVFEFVVDSIRVHK